jgi:hypothetical protein
MKISLLSHRRIPLRKDEIVASEIGFRLEHFKFYAKPQMPRNFYSH